MTNRIQSCSQRYKNNQTDEETLNQTNNSVNDITLDTVAREEIISSVFHRDKKPKISKKNKIT